jgi:hypothetical protein
MDASTAFLSVRSLRGYSKSSCRLGEVPRSSFRLAAVRTRHSAGGQRASRCSISSPASRAGPCTIFGGPIERSMPGSRRGNQARTKTAIAIIATRIATPQAPRTMRPVLVADPSGFVGHGREPCGLKPTAIGSCAIGRPIRLCEYDRVCRSGARAQVGRLSVMAISLCSLFCIASIVGSRPFELMQIKRPPTLSHGRPAVRECSTFRLAG